jgi:exosortase K
MKLGLEEAGRTVDDATPRRDPERRRWPLYLLTGAVTLLLKTHYSWASATQLQWILAPTARLVELLLGEPLHFEPVLGWVAGGRDFTIAPACAGVNFLIVVIAAAGAGLGRRLPSFRRQWVWLAWVVLLGYGMTVLINSLRIVIAVELYRFDLHTATLTHERIHRLAGTLVYLGGLGTAWALFSRLCGHAGGGVTTSRSSLGLWLLPTCYLGLTVIAPWLNGASGALYLEHALTVALLTLASAAALAVFRIWFRNAEAASANSHPC